MHCRIVLRSRYCIFIIAVIHYHCFVAMCGVTACVHATIIALARVWSIV